MEVDGFSPGPFDADANIDAVVPFKDVKAVGKAYCIRSVAEGGLRAGAAVNGFDGFFHTRPCGRLEITEELVWLRTTLKDGIEGSEKRMNIYGSWEANRIGDSWVCS